MTTVPQPLLARLGMTCSRGTSVRFFNGTSTLNVPFALVRTVLNTLVAVFADFVELISLIGCRLTLWSPARKVPVSCAYTLPFRFTFLAAMLSWTGSRCTVCVCTEPAALGRPLAP